MNDLKTANENILNLQVDSLSMLIEKLKISQISILDIQNSKAKLIQTMTDIVNIDTALNQNAISLIILQENIMIKIFVSSLILFSCAFANEINLENAQMRKFGKSVELNSKVIQLPSSKQSLMALLDGKIIKYYVKEGDIVKRKVIRLL